LHSTYSFPNHALIVSSGTTGNTVSGNISSDIFDIDGTNHTVTHNQMMGEFNGAYGGFLIKGTGHVVSSNVVTGTPWVVENGFAVSGSGHSLINNVVVGTNAEGIVSDASNVIIRGNTILGSNYLPGIALGPGASGTINENNLFGNGVTAGNCGFSNNSGTTIDASNNFWGAASGPGPDPADAVCDEAGSSTTVSPFATQQFAIASPGGGGSGSGSPVCTAAQAVPSMLWPANGQFLSIGIIGVGDPENDPVTISISAVTQDEPTGGAPDATVGGSNVNLRAERQGGGNGRVYRVQFGANDGNGGSCTGAVTVGVPKNPNNGPAVDDGQNFDSTLP
jgi:parallel beta-helix repeat protein